METELTCKHCGKPFLKKFNCKRHELTCKANPINLVNINWVCRHCGKSCKNDNSLRNHERLCPSNTTRNYVSYTIGHVAWNRGLTKDTDARVKQYGETYSSRVKEGIITMAMTGKHHSGETKAKMSESHKKQWTNGESIFATAREHRRSYPEEYFAGIFDDAKQNYHVLRYFLDFAWPDKKIYAEVDGEQHYTKQGILHDTERTNMLESIGWKCIARIRWKDFKRMSDEQKKMFIETLISKINDIK